MAQTEVIIQPTIDRQSLKRVETQYKRTFDAVARDAGKSLYDSLSAAIKRIGSINLRAAGGGAARAGGTLFGAAVGALFAAGAQYETGAQFIQSEIGENESRLRVQSASALGATGAQYQNALSALRDAGSLDDPTSRDLIFTLLSGIQEGAASFDLSQFSTDIGGVNSLLRSLGQLDTQTQLNLLREIGIADNEDVPLVQGLIARGGFGEVTEADRAAARRTEQLASLENDYQDIQRQLSRRRQEALIEEFTAAAKGGTDPLDAILAKESQQIERQQIALSSIEENAKASLIQDKAINAALVEISDTVHYLLEKWTPTINAIGEFIENPADKINEGFEGLARRVENAIKSVSLF